MRARAAPEEMILHVRLTPRAASTRIDAAEPGEDGRWRLRARVRAIPEKGAANAALLRLLADALGVALSSLAIEAGGTFREKRVRFSGDPARLEHVLRALAPGGLDDAARP